MQGTGNKTKSRKPAKKRIFREENTAQNQRENELEVMNTESEATNHLQQSHKKTQLGVTVYKTIMPTHIPFFELVIIVFSVLQRCHISEKLKRFC